MIRFGVNGDASLLDHLQPWGVHRRDQVRLHGYLPERVPAMRGLVRLSTSRLHSSRPHHFVSNSFIQTNQTSFLDSDAKNLPSVLDGMHKICALASTLLGGVATADGEVTPTSSLAVATATSTTNGASPLASEWSVAVIAIVSSMVAALL